MGMWGWHMPVLLFSDRQWAICLANAADLADSTTTVGRRVRHAELQLLVDATTVQVAEQVNAVEQRGELAARGGPSMQQSSSKAAMVPAAARLRRPVANEGTGGPRRCCVAWRGGCVCPERSAPLQHNLLASLRCPCKCSVQKRRRGRDHAVVACCLHAFREPGLRLQWQQLHKLDQDRLLFDALRLLFNEQGVPTNTVLGQPVTQ